MRNACPSFAVNYEYQSGGESTPLGSPRFAYMLRISRYLRCGLYDSRVKRSGAKDTAGGKGTKGVSARMVREELNREEDTNVTVKRHVVLEMYGRERTRRVELGEIEKTWTCTRIGWKRAKGVGKRSEEEERGRMGRAAFYSSVLMVRNVGREIKRIGKLCRDRSS